MNTVQEVVLSDLREKKIIAFGKGYPVYHSIYDDFIWMKKFGDPMFHRHVAAASIWGLVALHLADEEFLPFNYLSYVSELQEAYEIENILGKISVARSETLAEGLILEKTSCPLGVLLIVFESRPEALVQITLLAIWSGNGLLLKGGKVAKRSNAILHKVITESIPDTVGEKLIGLVTLRDEIPDLLKLDDVIDLVIPRGSNKLVLQIKESTKIPVLGHADGICHVYVDKSINIDMAKRIVLDAKIDYPAACNAMETLLIPKDLVKIGGLNEPIVGLHSKVLVLTVSLQRIVKSQKSS